jgi:hypothetical protein
MPKLPLQNRHKAETARSKARKSTIAKALKTQKHQIKTDEAAPFPFSSTSTFKKGGRQA